MGKRRGKKNRVECEIDYTETLNDQGKEVKCVEATCSECGHKTMSYGHGIGSIKRCMAVMNNECSEGGNNFYFNSESEDNQL